MENLTANELKNLIKAVFPRKDNDRQLAILVDVPDQQTPDDPAWRIRREIAKTWALALDSVKRELSLQAVNLVYYPNVHNNNADLPVSGFLFDGSSQNLDTKTLESKAVPVTFEKIFQTHQIFLVPSRFSATAPMKLMAKKYGFRAATMPGFSPEMLPALKLDYDEVSRRVNAIKELVDPAVAADIHFLVDQQNDYHLHLDLRFRLGHDSSGSFPVPGIAGNLPSGECYIVPYEGEKSAISESSGNLPVQLENDVLIYRIERNKAMDVTGEGPLAVSEAEKIKREPAYANLSELGFGVLADFGIEPIGEILLDEKLGLHIAFGRSDHFGGAVGVKDFSSPEAVEHTDRIYLPETQQRIAVKSVKLIMPDGSSRLIMENGAYVIF